MRPRLAFRRTNPTGFRTFNPGLLLLVAALLLGSGCGRARPPGVGDKEPLAAALAAIRPGDGRLANAPWIRPALASSPPPKNAAVRAAARATGRAQKERLTAESLRQDAVVALLADETDRAISELSRAASLDPANADLWNDLSVAHLRRSSMDPYDLVLALAAANRAVKSNPALLAARFNRALVLERLSLRARAAEDWQHLERFETDPLWREEAEARAKKLARSANTPSTWPSDLQAVSEAAARGSSGKIRGIVSPSRQRFREYLEEELLGQWALAEAQGRTRLAGEHLTVARAIADALVEVGGDGMGAETIRHIDLVRRTGPRRLRQLAAGFSAYHQGLKLYQKNQFSAALTCFRKAERQLARQGSPFFGWASYQIANCHYQLSDYRQARIKLLGLEDERRKGLHGRALWLKGLIESIEGSPTVWLTAHSAAEADFRSIGENANANRLSSLLALNLDLLGQRKESWRKLYPALIDSASLDTPRVRFSLCESASWLAQEQGEIEIALLFQEEVVRSAQLLGKPLALIGALHNHAALLTALGRKDEAAQDLSQAWKQLEHLSDLPTRRSAEGDLRLAEGKLAVTVSPQQAIRSLDRAIEIFRATSYHFQLGQALYLRSSAELALGRKDNAERDLLAAIAESERQRELISSAEDRISYFDRKRELLDTMVSFQLERRNAPVTALRFSEQAKARVLWDWILTHPGSTLDKDLDRTRLTPTDTKPLQQDLPKDTAVIEYAVLPQSTIIWILRREAEPRVVTVKGGADVLGDLVQKLHRAVLNNQTAVVETVSEKLYDALLKPVAGDLIPGERLVFVADGTLHALPFSLLRDPKTRRYLVQDHVSSVAPSIRFFKASLRRDEALRRRLAPRALVVADPDFDHVLYPLLVRLKSADIEASIAQIFPGSPVLRDRDATRRAFLRSAGDFEIVHFGGHSVVNAEFPLLSQLVLAKEPGDPSRGVLYSGDILRQRFPRTRLVVLASCSTALGKISRTEGVENLARPFLATGVPAVVASLWDVNDEVSASFFTRFYRHLKKGWDVAGALQATQVEAIEQGSGRMAKPQTWAAFEVIGGSVTDRQSP